MAWRFRHLVLDGPMWRRRPFDLAAAFRKMDQGVVAGIHQVETVDEFREELAEQLDEHGIDASSGQATVGDF